MASTVLNVRFLQEHKCAGKQQEPNEELRKAVSFNLSGLSGIIKNKTVVTRSQKADISPLETSRMKMPFSPTVRTSSCFSPRRDGSSRAPVDPLAPAWLLSPSFCLRPAEPGTLCTQRSSVGAHYIIQRLIFWKGGAGLCARCAAASFIAGPCVLLPCQRGHNAQLKSSGPSSLTR